MYSHNTSILGKRFISKLLWRKTLQTPFDIFLLDVNFENLIVGLYVLIMFSMLANFKKIKDQ